MADNQQTNQYVENLLKDLHLENLQVKEREDTLNMLKERFDQVIFNTTVRMMDEHQKVEYIKAAQEPDKNEKKIMEITSQVPGLSEAIEAALLFEYESLKRAMGK